MKNNKLTKFGQALLAACLLSLPLSGVYAACCAGHGGVASCDKKTGYQKCKDHTNSPSCKCAIPATKAKNNKMTPATTTTTTTTTPAKSKKGWWGGKSTDTTTTTTTPAKSKNSWWGGKSTTTKSSTTTSAKGCCSKHGGVDQCNRATKHQRCKDGSDSPSCMCQ